MQSQSLGLVDEIHRYLVLLPAVQAHVGVDGKTISATKFQLWAWRSHTLHVSTVDTTHDTGKVWEFSFLREYRLGKWVEV